MVLCLFIFYESVVTAAVNTCSCSSSFLLTECFMLGLLHSWAINLMQKSGNTNEDKCKIQNPD